MDDPTDQRRSPGEGEEIDVGAVGLEIESVADDSTDSRRNQPDDDPPEYAIVLADEESDPVDAGSEAPPLSYEAVIAGDTPSQPAQPAPSKVLTAEAPPSYIQLFGKDKVDGAGRRRRRRRRLEDDDDDERTGHWRLLNLVPTDRKSAYRCGAVVALLLLLSALSLSMIVVGFTHYNECSVREVPLYLIVGGIFLLVEVVLHSLLWTAQKLSNDEPVYSLIRKFDCIALFLIVWLVVGSAWIFKASKDNLCGDNRSVVDQVLIPGNSTGGFEDSERSDSGASEECEDCPSGVYVFTVFLILFQYLMILLLGIGCCTSSVRSRRH